MARRRGKSSHRSHRKGVSKKRHRTHRKGHTKRRHQRRRGGGLFSDIAHGVGGVADSLGL